jgi:hypothetical protein
MSDGTTIKKSASQTVDGDTIATEDRGAYKTPLSLIDVGGRAGPEAVVGDTGVYMPVTVSAALPAGNNNIGDVDAVQSGSWTVTANAGTNLNTSLLALESGGNLAAIATSLAALDNAVAGNELQVDIVSGTISLPTGASTLAEQQSQTTHLSNIATSVGTLDNAISGSEMQVDVVGALPAGTNNIGDVDVLTVPTDPFGANADAASATGSISAKLRFMAATGIPITGTVAVTQSGTWDEVGINDSGNSITVDAPVGTPVFVRLSDGSTAISTLPVSLASVPSHAVTNAGVFATQSTLQTGDNTAGRFKLTDGTDVADVLDLTNSNPLTVAIVDGSGDQIISFGGGTQYTEGDTDATITGTAVMWEDGSNTLRAASAAKPLPVEIIAGGGTGGTSAADDADFTDGTTPGTPAMGVYELTPSSVTDGDLGVVGITVTRSMKVYVGDVVESALVNIETSSGASAVSLAALDNAIAGNELQVDVVGALPAGNNNIGDVDVASIVPGTGATNLGKAIDTATGATDTGVLALATRDDALSSLTPAEGDNVQLRTDATGALWANVATSALPSGGSTSAKQDTIIGHLDGVETVLGTIDADTSVLAAWEDSNARCNVSLIPTQEGVQGASGNVTGKTLRVTIATDDASVASLALLDDTVFVDDAAFTLGTSKGVMVMGFAGTQSVDANDAAALACTTAGALRVNVENTLTVSSHAVTNAGVFAVQIDAGAVTSLALIDDCIFTDDAAYTPGASKLAVVGAQADEGSTDSVDEGDAGALRMTLDRKLYTVNAAHTAGGCLAFSSIDIDETEEEVKATAGQVYGIHCMNMTIAPLFLKFYNLTAANTTVGSSTPVLTFPVPGNNDSDGGGFTLSIPSGIIFDTAICVACTTGVAAADTGAPAANACIVNILYK